MKLIIYGENEEVQSPGNVLYDVQQRNVLRCRKIRDIESAKNASLLSRKACSGKLRAGAESAGKVESAAKENSL